MRNYVLDWNNMDMIIVKKGYLKKVLNGNGREAVEVENLKKNGFSLKDGTNFSVGVIENACYCENSTFLKLLPLI